MKIAFAKALESFEGFLAVVGDGVIDALFDVWPNVIGASLSQLSNKVIDLREGIGSELALHQIIINSHGIRSRYQTSPYV